MRSPIRAVLLVLAVAMSSCGDSRSGTHTGAGGTSGGPRPSADGPPDRGGSTGPVPRPLPDPAALEYLTYINAASWAGPVVDPTGRVFVAVGVPPPSGAQGRPTDVVVRQLGDGAVVLSERRLSESSTVNDISIAPDGDVLVTGDSWAKDFPTTTGSGSGGAFVSRLSPDLSTLRFSTVFSKREYTKDDYHVGWTQAVADTAGRIIVGGREDSAYGSSTFLLRLSRDGSVESLGWWPPSYFGGMAADSSDRVYLALSEEPLPRPDEVTGNEETLVVWSEASPPSSIHLRSHGGDFAGPVVLSGGLVYMAGTTTSTTFPVTAGAVQAVSGGGRDAFVAVLRADTGEVVWATFFGGSGDEWASGLAVAPDGRVAVVGSTGSSDLPLVHAIQRAAKSTSSAGYPFMGDAFVMVLSPDGSQLELSTYLAGSDNDAATGVAWDRDALLVSGYTQSIDLPRTDPDGPGLVDGRAEFVARIAVP